MDILLFEKLGTLPLEADIIIVIKKSTQDLIRKYPDLKFLIPYLSKYTAIEYKSPLDRLTFDDFDTGRAYMLLAKRKYGIKHDKDINIVFLCSSFENDYPKYINENGCDFNKIEKGVYGHKSKKGSNIYWINLKEIGENDPGNVFKLFSISVRDYNSSKPIEEIRDIELLGFIVKRMFFNKEKIMSGLELRQKKEFTNTMESFKAMFLSNLSASERVAGLGPEERLRGLGPEERLRGLRSEDVITFVEREPVKAVFLNKLSPEERLKGLGPEERLKGLGPEERLKGLGPEDIKRIKEYLDKTS
jgi:hypothetical protein